jgi:hypothetical protein
MQTPFPISDDQSIASAKGRFGHPIPVYDDGFGPLFIHRDSMGISGIVRAMTWEDAYSICEDEFFPEASKTMEELVKEYGFKREHVKVIRTIEGVEREDLPSDFQGPFAPLQMEGQAGILSAGKPAKLRTLKHGQITSYSKRLLASVPTAGIPRTRLDTVSMPRT